MGVDCHVVIERFEDGRWHHIGYFQPYRSTPTFKGVRSVGYEVTKLPHNADPRSRAPYDEYASDFWGLRVLEHTDILELAGVNDGWFARWLCASDNPWIDIDRLAELPLRAVVWFDS